MSEEEDRSTSEVLRLGGASATGWGGSSGDSRTSCSAARSSGVPFFLTCCRSRIASATSTCETEAKDSLESARPASWAAELCLLRKHDKELVRELALEFVREFDLEPTVDARPRVFVTSPNPSSSCVHVVGSNSLAIGESSASLICWRPSGVRSADLDVVGCGESSFPAALAELVFVFGLDSLLWFSVLGWLPILKVVVGLESDGAQNYWQ